MRSLFVFIMMLSWCGLAYSDEVHVVINGKALHIDDGNFNEDNWGLGFEYDFAARKDWITFINSSYFKDSNNQTSKYAGGGMKRRFMLDTDADGWRVDAGLIAFLMTRKDFKNNEPFFGVLPFVSIGVSWFTLNVTYIPEVSPKHKDLLFFQAMIRLAEF